MLFRLLCVNFSKSAEDGFAADVGSVSGDGHSFRYCTVGELLRDCDCVSVRAVQEKCDDKGLKAAFGHRSLKVSAVVQGPFSKSARRGAPPARTNEECA